MNARPSPRILALTLASGGLLFASAASAQDEASATTRSLNTAPAQSTLTPRPNAQPPLAAAPPTLARPSRSVDRTLEDLLGDVADEDSDAESAEGVTLAAGETEPAPIPMTLGYYARGEVDCEQVWPGDGDLAWATPTSFTIDYGGCEPGPWLQTGPNRWREDQRCLTESGGDAGGYTITYEVVDTATVKRTARLALDGSVEEDLWTACRLETVPENARFAS